MNKKYSAEVSSTKILERIMRLLEEGTPTPLDKDWIINGFANRWNKRHTDVIDFESGFDYLIKNKLISIKDGDILLNPNPGLTDNITQFKDTIFFTPHSQTKIIKAEFTVKKKLQVFVSSTYLDLKEERQKAVEGILRAGHIPAGMELFTAANKSQWNVIEEWIKESDILMLIFGGKYGSVEPESGKSYTQLEYEFALKHNIPVFAVALNEQYLADKKSTNISLQVYENEVTNPEIHKYKEFKKLVESNLVRFISNINEITAEVTLSLKDFMEKDSLEYNFRGWVRPSEINEDEQLKEKR